MVDPITPPTNLGFGTVVWQVADWQTDSSDGGDIPDFNALTGTVTFTPTVLFVNDATADPNPLTLAGDVITGTLGPDGYLGVLNGSTFTAGVKLPATNDPDTNPTNFAYKVDFTLRNSASKQVRLPSFNIAVPEGETVDLALNLTPPSAEPESLAAAEANAAIAAQAALDAEAAAEAAEDALDHAVTPRHVTHSDSPVTAVNRDLIIVDASAGSVLVAVPVTAGSLVRVERTDATGNTVTVTCAGTIDGDADATLIGPYLAAEFIGDGTNVFIGSVSSGASGDPGPAGAPGVGLPTGGTSGQLPIKQSATDYDVAWTTPPYAAKSANLSDLANAATARTNLGLAAVAASGSASDITTGTLPTAVLPDLAITDVSVVASQAAMLALTAQKGDVAVRTDNGKTYILSTNSPTTLADWKEITAAGAVTSVNGQTGVVSLVKADVGLGSVDNTSDASKPVSTAQAAADTAATAAAQATSAQRASNLSDLANAGTARTNLGLGTAATQASTAFDAAGAAAAAQAASQPLDSDLTAIAALTPSNDDLVQRKSGAWTNRTPAQVKTDLALTKGDVGLSNVDNTSDAGKPVSVATQTALDLKDENHAPYLGPSGAMFENIPRWLVPSTQTQTSGVLFLTSLVLPAGVTIGHLGFVSANAQTSPTNYWFGLFDSSRNLLALTADQTTTVWTSNTPKSLAIATTAAGAASSYTTTYTGQHYIGIMQAAATPSTIVAVAATTAMTQIVPILAGTSNTGMTTPPAFPFTANALTANAKPFYTYVGA